MTGESFSPGSHSSDTGLMALCPAGVHGGTYIGGHNPVAPVVTSPSGEGASTTPKVVTSASQIIGAIPGFSTVPPKLIHKITSGEYVDMGELLPETWRLDEAQGGCCQNKRPRRGMITDF